MLYDNEMYALSRIFFCVLGKGLGKNEDGILQIIKPTLKFNNAGIGYKETFENYWQKSFDNAAKNIKIESHDDQVFLSVINNNQNTILPKKNEKDKLYQTFLKVAVLHNGSLVQDLPRKSEKNKTAMDLLNIPLTDEQLYAACNGRTAYKTARHALTLNGKLERIAQQDRILLDASTTNTSQCNTYKIDYNNYIDHNYSWHKLTEHFLEKPMVFPLNDTKEYTEKINKLSEKLSTCDLKEGDAESKQKPLKNKRKRYQDCVIKIDPLEMEDIYFCRKKSKIPLDLSLEKVDESKKQKSYEQIETDFKKIRIKQKTREEIEREPDSVCYEINKQLGRQSTGRIVSRVQCVKFADMWNKMTKMGAKPLDYFLIKRILDIDKHMDLPNNIKKCIIQYPWIEMSLRKLYFTTIKKKYHMLKDQKKIQKKEFIEWKKIQKKKSERKMKYKKIRTQTHLTPV
jgi:hypothetical protein